MRVQAPITEDVSHAGRQRKDDKVNEVEQGEGEEAVEVLDISPLKKMTSKPCLGNN